MLLQRSGQDPKESNGRIKSTVPRKMSQERRNLERLYSRVHVAIQVREYRWHCLLQACYTYRGRDRLLEPLTEIMAENIQQEALTPLQGVRDRGGGYAGEHYTSPYHSSASREKSRARETEACVPMSERSK